jgi:hypothetical protein
VDQLKDELETLQQKLELVLATDPGVIDQYERRKEEVCSIMMFGCSGCESHFGRARIRSLTKKIEDRERAAGKVEKSMKVVRVGPIDTQRVPSANGVSFRIIGTLLCKTSSHPSERDFRP